MGDFWRTTRPRSRTDRICPECGEPIPAGAIYVRHAGVSDGDMISAFQCEPCDAFAERYLVSLALSEILNFDEKTYQFGSLLSEAAEFTGYLWSNSIDDQTPAQQRDAMLPLFDQHDEAERKHQEDLRALRERAQKTPAGRAALQKEEEGRG